MKFPILYINNEPDYVIVVEFPYDVLSPHSILPNPEVQGIVNQNYNENTWKGTQWILISYRR